MAVVLALGAAAAHADSLTPPIVIDPLTGIAIEGYDPVTYFTESEPQRGLPDYALEWQGVPWYFANAANRDAFERAPEIYAPQHGGHCEMSLARGFLSDGKPRIYAIYGLRLYLFYSTANRDAFLQAKAETTAIAANNWPALARDAFGIEVATPAPVEPAPAEPAPAGNGHDTGGHPTETAAHTTPDHH